MIEQLISFETAKLAKEKGFDIKVLYHYWFENNKWILKSNEESVRGVDIFTTGSAIIINVEELLDNYDVIGNPEIFKAAPTQSLLQKWLREIHNIDISIFQTGLFNRCWFFNIYSKESRFAADLTQDSGNNYEGALEKALVIGLNLIKKI